MKKHEETHDADIVIWAGGKIAGFEYSARIDNLFDIYSGIHLILF